MAVSDNRIIWQPVQCPSEQLSQGLRRQLLSTNRSDTADYHNAFMEYSLVLMLFSTGHRPVQDPFCYRHKLDEQSGLVLIDDKATNEHRRYQVAYLPDVAIEQMNHYLRHLFNLARSERALPNIEIRNAIKQLLELNSKQIIPLFFYMGTEKIELIDSQRIEKLYEKFSPLPANIHRKRLATLLAEKKLPAWLIASAMRHTETNVLPNGDFCRESHRDIRESINECLNPILKNKGWQGIASEYRPQYGKIHALSKGLCMNRPLGELARQQSRKDRQIKARIVVKEFIEKLLSGPMPDEAGLVSWLDDAYVSLVGQLQEKSLPVKNPLKWFQRYVALYGSEILKTKMRLWSREASSESSHWRAQDLLLYRKAVFAREHLIKLLSQVSKSNLDNETQRLQIRILSVATLAIFSGVIGANDLIAVLKGNYTLSRAGDSLVLQIGSNVFQADQSVIPIDPVSASLISQLKAQTKKGALPTQALYSMLVSLGLDSKKRTVDALCSVLCEQASALIKIESPGVYRASFSGRLETTPFEAKVLARLCYEKPLDLSFQLSTSPRLIYELSVKPYQADQPTKDTKAFLLELNQSMSDEAQAIFIAEQKKRNSKKVFQKNQLSLHQKREYLSAVIEQTLKKKSLPMLGQMIAHWGVHLCKNQTRHNNTVEAETILKYLNLVSGKLVQISGEAVLYYEPTDWEDAYLAAISGSAIAAMRNLAARLYDFHFYLTRNWRIPQINWSVIFATAGMKDTAGRVDANILTPFEYHKLMSFLRNEINIGNLELQYCAWLLMMGYRFALRWSEAYYLKFYDVVFVEDKIQYLRIRDNEYRRVKTPSSRRTIPILEQLTKTEITLAQNVFNTHWRAAGPDDEDSLLCINPMSTERFDEVRISIIVNSLLKQVSGDQRLHFHNLRHSNACRQWLSLNQSKFSLSLLKPLNEENSINNNDFNIHELTGVFPLKSVSDYLGHSGMATTVHSYIHIIQWTGLVEANRLSLSNSVIAFLLDQNEVAVRKKRRRHESKDSWNWLAQELKAKVPEIPVPMRENVTLNLDEFDSIVQKNYSTRVRHAALVNYATNDRSLERTAKQLELPKNIITSWIDTGVESEKNTGYERFSLNPIIAPTSTDEFSGRREWERVDDALKLIDNSVELFEKSIHIAAIWQKAFHPSTNDYFFEGYEDIVEFIRFLNELGVQIDEGGFWVKGSLNRDFDQFERLSLMGIKPLSRPTAYQRQAKGRSYRKLAVVLRITRLTGTLVRKRQINRLMFLISSTKPLVAVM